MKHFTAITISLIISWFNTSVLCINQTQFCSQDMSEAMFQAKYVVLAKVKSIKDKSSGSLLDIRISKVIKSDPGYPVKPKNRLKIHYKHKFCKPIKVKRKYIFSLANTGGTWHVECRPVTASKKIKKMMQNLFCSQCGKGPTVRAISSTKNVNINRWRNLNCRLSSGKEPKVRFIWFHNGKPVRKGPNFKIKTRKSGSVLNIRGLPETAGHYTCMASSIAGHANASSTLYVHGTVHSACGAAYCLNGGACSVAVVAPGEHQVVCQCVAGYAGARCELKHVTGMLTSDAVIIAMIILCGTAIILLMLHINKRLKNIEATEKFSKKCEPNISPGQLLDTKKMQNGNHSKPTHNYQHCGYVRASPQFLQPNGKLQVTKSASSPGMQSLATNQTPISPSLIPCSSLASPSSASLINPGSSLIHPGSSLIHPGSSQSSVHSTGSVKLRRPGAPDNLTFDLTTPENKNVYLSVEHPSPSPSPLYVEPWDKASYPCIHGTGDIKCSVCHIEAVNIVTQCHTWSNHV